MLLKILILLFIKKNRVSSGKVRKSMVWCVSIYVCTYIPICMYIVLRNVWLDLHLKSKQQNSYPNFSAIFLSETAFLAKLLKLFFLKAFLIDVNRQIEVFSRFL